jgi:uncharacterized protein (TIGR03086 family)
MEVLPAYERTLVWTGQRVAGVRPDDLGHPTPCTEWDVRALVAHIVAGIWYFKALAAGEPVEDLMRGLTDLVGDDPLASYDQAARAGLDAWRGAGALDRSYRLPMGERPGREALAIHQADLLIHGWDLAEATHQDATMDPELAAFALATERWFVQPEMRGPKRAYAAAVPDAAASSDQEHLLALVGRTASWR